MSNLLGYDEGAQSGVGPREQLRDVGGPVRILSDCKTQIFPLRISASGWPLMV